MAFKFTQKYKKQKYLLGALLLVLIITALIWWKGFYSPSGPSREFPSSFEGKQVSIDFTVLEDEIFEEMEPFLRISMPTEVGKQNPFFRISATVEQPVEGEEEEEE